MDAVELLLTRSSMPRLIAPGPDDEALKLMQRAALRVPDHMDLTPYQFIILQGDDLVEFGQVFEKAAVEERLPDNVANRAAQLPVRAPTVMVVATRYTDHEKVPRWEQLCSAATAAFAVEQMAFALGYGAIWRTGPFAEMLQVKKALNIEAENDVLGFLYLGTPAVPTPIKPEKDREIFRRYKKA